MDQAGQSDGARQFMPLAQVFELVEQHRGAGRLDEAEVLLKQVLASRPKEPTAIHLLGIVAHQRGQLTQAIEHVKRAIELAPNVALFQANLGEMYRLAGRADLAIEHGRRAVALNPDYPEALSNIGVAQYERKEYEEAVASHRRAIELRPAFAQGHSNLGNALHALRRFEEAVACYRRAVDLDPRFADAWSNLGTSLHHSGRYDDAMFALRRALALDPQSANAHSGLGILLLMRGDFAEGWDEYEWRLKSTEVRMPYTPQRPWLGESLAGKRIYLHAEQGFGDTMQFARYVPLVAARGAAVTFRVQQGLAGLMRESLPGIEVLGDRAAAATIADYECALLSLPRIFGTRLETIPAIGPYLRANADETARWRARLGGSGLKVGIVWAGNPEHVNDSRRSIPLGLLAPLFALPDVSFTSLQVGPRADELKAHPEFRIADIASDLVGFAATAAVIEALDVVITIDSAVSHLAGGLGKPTWLLTPWVSDWRWLLHREDNPWYPTMRLFRQVEGETWPTVMQRVAAELGAAAKGDAARLMPFRAAGERRAAQAAEIIAAIEQRQAAPAAIAAAAPILSPPQTLALAEQRRMAGKLAEAELLCRRVLEAKPDNGDAYHLLGIIAHQSGNLAHAIDHLKRATALAPEVALYHANLGEMFRLAKHTDEAVAEGKRALAINPDYPDALSNLGIAYYEQEKFADALACYDRAIALRPQFVEANSNRGNALRALKRLDEAMEAYRRALDLRPNFADAWNNLGTTLRDLKKPDEAETAYRKALALKPDDPEMLDSLALALKDLHREDEAEAMLRRSLAIDPRNEKTLLYLSTSLLDAHKTDEAAALIEQAYALNPNNHDVLNSMGRIAFDQGDLDAALAHHRRALELKPDLADALNNMGNVLKELGRLDEAHDSYLKSLAIDSKITGVYVNLADSKKFTPDDPHLAAMEALEQGVEPLSDTDRLQLDFALAKAYADIKDHKRSFEHLLRANAGKRAQVQYDEPAAFALFDRIEAVFSPALISQKVAVGDPTRLPIFVMGMPRSGTTLVEQIIASHPDVYGAGELKTLNDVVNEVRGGDGSVIPYPDFVPALDAKALRQIAARYLGAVRKLAPDARHITDKMPSNYYFAGLIHVAMPNAVMIHTIRDPVDTCISCFSKLFTAEQNHTYELGELGRYHRRYRQLMAHWRRVLPPGRILDVRYEEVVDDLETQARRIIAHCGLPWSDACLSFHETDRPIRTASASQVRQPIYRTAVGRWRVYEEFLDPLLTALGPND
ncbi:MAG TPA: tetratricopeptide repeat protein [Stellaceae bacterium]|jgi:tetratricopeptide (TPR) repeat protein|nr:tetratricopeptide repeat protein [Stellaceae bacterium]